MRECKLPLYGRGIQRTKAGHLRYTSPREFRGQYVHRKRIEDQIAETPYSIRLLLPYPYEVHHIDFDKTNNGDFNLLMLSESFHSSLTCRQLRVDGQFAGYRPKWKPALDWKLFDDDANEVPF